MKIIFVGGKREALERTLLEFQKNNLNPLFLENSQDVLDLVVREKETVLCVILATASKDGHQAEDYWGLCQNLREVPGVYIHIIMLIDEIDAVERIQGYNAGVDHFIKMPLDENELLTVIRVGQRITSSLPKVSADALLVKASQLKMPGLAPKTMVKKSRRDYMVAKIALANKMIDRQQLSQAMVSLKRKEKSDLQTTLDGVLAEEGFVPPDQMHKLQIVVKRQLGKQFGEKAVEKGFVDEPQVELALLIQAEEFRKTNNCRRLGDILVSQGMITEEELALLRQEQENVDIEIGADDNSDPKKETTHAVVEETAQSIEETKPSETIPARNLMKIKITSDNMRAGLIIEARPKADIPIEDIKALLREKEIWQGIVADDVILTFLSELDGDDNELLIARGIPPEPGQDAYLKYYFDTDYLKAGTFNDDGDIDYRHRGEPPYVTKGDLLAEKIPLKPGKSGVDVYGNTIPMTDGSDIKILCGEGVTLTDDEMKVYAAIDGEPKATKTGKISVYAELKIDGDVDFNTGNIEFKGNVHVKGAVKEGFSVKCGNLTVNELFAAEIDVEGDVFVSGGIIGAQVKTEGALTAKYIKDANIKAFGDVAVEKEVFNSKIRSSSKVLSQNGKLVSSYIAAKHGIQVKDVGTDVSKPCNLRIGVDENVRKVLQGFDIQIALKKNQLETVQAEYESTLHLPARLQGKMDGFKEIIQKIDDKISSTQIRMDELNAQPDDPELTKIVDLLTQLTDKRKALDEQRKAQEENQTELNAEINEKLVRIEGLVEAIEKLNEERNAIVNWSKQEAGVAELSVKGRLYAGTMVYGRRTSIKLKETARNVTIKEIHVPEKDQEWEMKLFVSQ